MKTNRKKRDEFFIVLLFLHSKILILIHFFNFCITEAAAKKGGKGAKKDRSPSAKKGSPKAGGKKGKKGN